MWQVNSCLFFLATPSSLTFLLCIVCSQAGGSFAVPFQYGWHDSYCSWALDSDDDNSERDSDCIGKVWTSEVDAEMARIGSLRPKSKPKAKRKPAKKRAAKEPGKRQSPDTCDEDGKPAALDRDAVQGARPSKTRKTMGEQTVTSSAGVVTQDTDGEAANPLSFSELKALLLTLRSNRALYEEYYGKTIAVPCKIDGAGEGVFNVVKAADYCGTIFTYN